MQSKSAKELQQTYLLSNYGEPSLTLVRGEGCYVWDENDKRYLDFGSGIAVNSLGHSHPHWVNALREQIGTLAHCSNLYRTEPALRVAEKLSAHLGGGRMFFCNSGTEANEALIKLARLHGRERSDGKEGVRYKIIGAQNGFHGRTLGGMSLTPQAKVQDGFAPLVPGFAFGTLNDIDSFARLIDDETAAIFIETIQGEGGIHCCSKDFLRQLRALCDRHGLMLILDEVQCGIGRSGALFAFEAAGIKPDAIGMAKGLGGGFPIGAIWVAEPFSPLFQPGSHGSTFGGNPLAGTAALAVLETIEQENLLQHVQTSSVEWHAALQQLKSNFSSIVSEIRGVGFMVGIVLTCDPLPIVSALREAGMLTVPAGGQVIRLLPPLIATSTQLKESVQLLNSVLDSYAHTRSAIC